MKGLSSEIDAAYASPRLDRPPRERRAEEPSIVRGEPGLSPLGDVVVVVVYRLANIASATTDNTTGNPAIAQRDTPRTPCIHVDRAPLVNHAQTFVSLSRASVKGELTWLPAEKIEFTDLAGFIAEDRGWRKRQFTKRLLNFR